MTQYPVFVLVASVLLAVAMAMVEDRTARERVFVAIRVCLWCAAATVGGSWVMHLVHG